MKKQIKPASPAGRKLNLSKRTITNLNSNEMSKQIGGAKTNGNGGTCNPTFNFTRRCLSF